MEQHDDEPSFVPIDASDPEMRSAIARARATFPDFVHVLEEDSKRLIPAVETALVKAYFADPDEPDAGEHIWVDVQEWTSSSISGEVLSQPSHVKAVQQGDEVTIQLARLSDWLYVIDGVAHGAYTVQLLRQRMPPDERREHDLEYPFLFDAPDDEPADARGAGGDG